MLDGRGFGNLCKLRERGIYGREIPLATLAADDTVAPVKWLRKLLGEKFVPRATFEADDAGTLAGVHSLARVVAE